MAKTSEIQGHYHLYGNIEHSHGGGVSKYTRGEFGILWDYTNVDVKSIHIENTGASNFDAWYKFGKQPRKLDNLAVAIQDADSDDYIQKVQIYENALGGGSIKYDTGAITWNTQSLRTLTGLALELSSDDYEWIVRLIGSNLNAGDLKINYVRINR